MTHEIKISSRTIKLGLGERYAGAVHDADGLFAYDLVLMLARPSERLSWQDALNWAEKVGGALPTRREQAFLFANCKEHLEDGVHWSCERHATDASYAWYCYFSSFYQNTYPQNFEGTAVAVRRVVC